MKIGKTKIDLSSFSKRRTPKIDDSYGLYCITGKQGSGKTYYAVKLAKNNLNKVKKIKTNIRSLFMVEKQFPKGITELAILNKPSIPIEYFSKISEIYYDDDEYCMYIIDEISRKYSKHDKCDVQFYAWLNQCRKTHRMCVLLTQEYKELPMWLRRPIKYQLSTVPTRFLWRFGVYTTYVGDGENPVLDKDTLEWECPILYKIISKRNMEIANLYDTFEPIPFL